MLPLLCGCLLVYFLCISPQCEYYPLPPFLYMAYYANWISWLFLRQALGSLVIFGSMLLKRISYTNRNICIYVFLARRWWNTLLCCPVLRTSLSNAAKRRLQCAFHGNTFNPSPTHRLYRFRQTRKQRFIAQCQITARLSNWTQWCCGREIQTKNPRVKLAGYKLNCISNLSNSHGQDTEHFRDLRNSVELCMYMAWTKYKENQFIFMFVSEIVWFNLLIFCIFLSYN